MTTVTTDDGDEWTDYTDNIDVEEGDTLRIVLVDGDSQREMTVDAATGLGSETVSEQPGFEHETADGRFSFETADGNTLTVALDSGLGDNGDRVGTLEAAGCQVIADVVELEVL